MAKPRHTAGPQFLLKSDMPGDPYSIIDSIAHNASRSGSIGLADAAGRAAQAFLGWKKGQPAEEWLVTADRIAADRLATWAHRLESIDATLCAQVRAVVEQMHEFLRLPASSPSSTATTDIGDDCSIRIGICSCVSGRACELCVSEKRRTDAILAEATARRDAILAAERAQEQQREARRAKIANERAERREARRAAVTVPSLTIDIPGEPKPLGVFLARLDDSGDVEAAVRTVGGLIRSLTLMQLPGVPMDRARLYSYEVTACRREMVALGVCEAA